MPEIAALLTLGFKRAYERAVEWLKKARYRSILIDLPEDFEPFLRTYMKGECGLEEVWRHYRYLTGLSQPFVDSLRYQMDPLFEYLSRETPPEEAYCYHDLSFHVESFKLAEEILLLEYRQRVASGVKAEDWRRILLKEAERSREALERVRENIKEKVKDRGLNVMLYGGYLNALMETLKKDGYSIRVVCLRDYWKSPLDVLRTMFARREVSDEELMKCVKEQMKYLDLVISHRNVDEAHEKWSLLTGLKRGLSR